MHYYYRLLYPCLCLLVVACSPTSDSTPEIGQFIQHVSTRTGIDFVNTIAEDENLNYFTFPYMYLGAGVAAADFDNDGLTDLFFTGNMVPNRLYRNQGDFQFADISAAAGVAGNGSWYTGVTVVDINNDGWQDIYLSVSGKDGDRRNQLFVNQGADAGAGLRFKEQGRDYGIADASPSIQGAFFDYDRDGDLDLYVINYPPAPFSSSNRYYRKKMEQLDPADSDHLYRNDGDGTFTDVSAASGIANYGLSLGLSVADFNGDGWDDLYISNDFSTPDRYLQNNGDGTFTDQLRQAFAQTALFGMGCDAADYDNDGRIDLVQADMTPGDNRRAKENMASMNPGAFWSNVRSGFHFQYMYNALQLNRGGPDDTPYFSNAAQMAGLAATDWSWAPLLADYDNDGHKDLFITNGIKREVNNRDFHQDLKIKINFGQTLDSIDYRRIPSEPVANFAFRNQESLAFEDVSAAWGLDLKGFSNGSVYADLDNDGDLDLAVSNVDASAAIYENQVAQHPALTVRLQGPANNRNGIGARVTVTAAAVTQTQHLHLTRGYQSSVSPTLLFGLGEATAADAVTVTWPDGSTEHRTSVRAQETIVFTHEEATLPVQNYTENPTHFVPQQIPGLDTFRHRENPYNDYQTEPLIPYQYSRLGPFLTSGDANNDGLDDLFIGSAYGEAPQLFVQQENGSFTLQTGPWSTETEREEGGVRFLDADGDGDLDLYLARGGNEFFRRPEFLQDQLLVNQGNGDFMPVALPLITAATGTIAPADFDGDGDLDLFVAGRHVPGEYPLAARSYLLRNEGGRDGALRYVDVTTELAPELLEAGMLTAATWADVNGNGRPELLLTGEWQPVRIFASGPDGLRERTAEFGLETAVGWFQSLATADMDGDGDLDIIAGNLGKNFKYHASPNAPFTVHSDDFDRNGRRDIVLGYHQDGEHFPLRGRQCSAEQIPALEIKFQSYESFAAADLTEVYGEQNLDNALSYVATGFASIYLENRGNDGFIVRPLPALAQLSSVNDILIDDYTGDGHPDVLLAGNLYRAEVETPRNDASIGLLLVNDGKGNLRSIPAIESGVFLPGDVKSLVSLFQGDEQLIVAGRNDAKMATLRFSVNPMLK